MKILDWPIPEFTTRIRKWFTIQFPALLLILTITVFYSAPAATPLPDSCRQLLLVLTDSLSANQGTMQLYQREEPAEKWQRVGRPIAVSLGRNGLAWGRGLHREKPAGVPWKHEGDGCSPAGMFTLSAVFGHRPANEIPGLKMPYLHLAEGVECVDDSLSRFYNRIVESDTVSRDWRSSEKMWHPGIWYDLGVVVDHNRNPVVKGAGSCIFLHNRAYPGETTSGCTAMDPEDMKHLVFWLDARKHPVLVQLTRSLYSQFQEKWGLP